MENLVEIFNNVKTIAVVGISDKPERPGGMIASYLRDCGYEVFGVHPTIREFDGIKVYPSLNDIPVQIDLIDIFLNAENLEAIVTDIIIAKPKYVWFQLNVSSESAAKSIEASNITLVQGRCIMVEHGKFNQ
ncbi:MAG: CoA-binding protein [Ignavibacteriaceae bacterium]